MQVTFVTKPIVDLPTASFNSQGITMGYNGHASENEQCYDAHAHSVPAVGTQAANGEGHVQCLV